MSNYSAVIRLTYKDTLFLLTGDAQAASEQEMLAGGANLKADVLKVGLHGSHTSTYNAFLIGIMIYIKNQKQLLKEVKSASYTSE
ncbi:MAG: hypothetical protein QHH06_13370 [Clostridiales bacterium]|jgi:beta-lactamase superfamily II metal-dependent hydrolase|nr:hypothetical protein [Eubacteriales bacterium]MDH7567431.1 hypothetical protein [Clostridiales bacterium]